MKRAAFFLTGLILILIAFEAGSQPHPVLGLTGFLCFFVAGVTLAVESLRRSAPRTAEALIQAAGLNQEADRQVLVSAIEGMNTIEQIYRDQVERCGSKIAPAGIFRARLFALYFAVSAMRLTFGSTGSARADKIWHLLSAEAGRGLDLADRRRREIAAETVQEQSHALAAEQRNVGSGQYALAAIYEKAVEESTGPAAAGRFQNEPPAVSTGRVTALGLGRWYALYRHISGKPAQNYAQGFAKSAEDSRLLGEGN